MTPERRRPLVDFGRHLAVGAVCAVIAWGALWLGGLDARPAYLAALTLTIVVLVFLVRRMQPQSQAPTDVTHGTTETSPLAYRDMFFLEYRLSWGSADAERYERRVRPLLLRLTEERLLQRHGIDLRQDPTHARQVTGETLWRILTDPPLPRGAKPPRRRTIESAISELEAI